MPESFSLRLLSVSLPLGLALCVQACSPAAPEDPPGTFDSGVSPPRSDGGVPADGGNADGGPIGEGPVLFLDWSNERGEPLALSVVQEQPGRAFALSDTTHAVQSNCRDGVCDYTWYDDEGSVLREHLGLAMASSDSFSPDGTKFAALEVDETFVCTSMGWSVPLVEGTWGLYDARTGERLVAHGPLVTDPNVIQSSFTSHGSIVRRETYDRTSCEMVESTPLSTTAPHAEPPALASVPSDPGYPPYVEDDTSTGQLIVTTRRGLNMPLGLVGLEDGDSYLELDGDHQVARQSDGFVHVLGGWPFSRATSMHLSTGSRHRAALASDEADFTATVVSSRWIVTCTGSLFERRRCDATDGSGEHPRRSFTAGGPLPALAGRADTVVTSSAGGEVWQLDLRSGVFASLGLPDMPARVVGNGAGIVLQGDDEAFGLTGGQPFRIGERARAVLVGSTQVEQPQSDVVFIVSSNETGSLTYLDIWNVATKRIVRVTDQLFYNPPHDAPFTADQQCAAPGFLRSVGPPPASAAQPGRFLHFTQFVPAAQPKVQTFVLPADLSAPPRMIAELEPDQCSPPLISASEARVWLPVVTSSGVRVALAPL